MKLRAWGAREPGSGAPAGPRAPIGSGRPWPARSGVWRAHRPLLSGMVAASHRRNNRWPTTKQLYGNSQWPHDVSAHGLTRW